mmetsp:Transcript_12893/g.19984  ORF Transcript_12893/g.19984 Transcript_12893/m.19984 type:complete len:693 (+) Transcript_12893:114-2192(+)
MSTSPTAAAPSQSIWELDGTQLESWVVSTQTLLPKADDCDQVQKMGIGEKLLQNLTASLKSLIPPKKDAEEPPTKRAKKESDNNRDDIPPEINDPFGAWVGQTDEPPPVEGAILVQLTTAGMINALTNIPDGFVTAKLLPTSPETKKDSIIPSAHNITYQQLRHYALALQRVVQTRLEADFLATTPVRIQDMLCPDLAAHEFKAVRKRVYETVMEGRGRHVGEADLDEEVPVASRTAEHDIERDKKCHVCNNQNQAEFTLDRKNGDIICTQCGTVAMESLMHEGSQFRKFEGELDRNHHGDAPNKLFSNAHNMATTLSGAQATSYAGGPGFGSQKKGIETVLRNAHAYTELNISQFGKGERKTRIGYKDRQKKDAFVQMTHIGDALHLHEAVVQRAKEIFAGFRDDRELVQSFKAVVCACLILSFEELSEAGLQLMKQRQQQDAEALLSNRANRRNELHNASMAGKGGLLLDMTKIRAEKEIKVELSAIEKKQASLWDLDDCRSWLLEASRAIAQQQSKPSLQSSNCPAGTREELEGKLVEHTMTLCNALETELKTKNSLSGKSGRVITPRVKSMDHLSIKWQHAHERGSGGKGGVGNSGRLNQTKNRKQQDNSGKLSKRTAGQVLLLKTAKKMTSLLNDKFAGEAFHKELRSLINRQEARKLKQRREESAQHRFQQMQRKPWLAKTAEAPS